MSLMRLQLECHGKKLYPFTQLEPYADTRETQSAMIIAVKISSDDNCNSLESEWFG